jgi:hypothetical protein
MKQIQQGMKEGKIAPIHPLNLMLNIIGLTIFPFIGRPIFQNDKGLSMEQFQALMQERKKMIPVWIRAILYTKA